jgi:hypothetical protein
MPTVSFAGSIRRERMYGEQKHSMPCLAPSELRNEHLLPLVLVLGKPGWQVSVLSIVLEDLGLSLRNRIPKALTLGISGKEQCGKQNLHQDSQP